MRHRLAAAPFQRHASVTLGTLVQTGVYAQSAWLASSRQFLVMHPAPAARQANLLVGLVRHLCAQLALRIQTQQLRALRSTTVCATKGTRYLAAFAKPALLARTRTRLGLQHVPMSRKVRTRIESLQIQAMWPLCALQTRTRRLKAVARKWTASATLVILVRMEVCVRHVRLAHTKQTLAVLHVRWHLRVRTFQAQGLSLCPLPCRAARTLSLRQEVQL